MTRANFHILNGNDWCVYTFVYPKPELLYTPKKENKKNSKTKQEALMSVRTVILKLAVRAELMWLHFVNGLVLIQFQTLFCFEQDFPHLFFTYPFHVLSYRWSSNYSDLDPPSNCHDLFTLRRTK